MEEDINKLLEEYDKLKEVINDAKTQQDFIKSKLKIIMERDSVDVLEGEKLFAKLSSRKTTTLDRKKIKEILGDDKFGEVTKISESSFIVIREKEDKVENENN